MTGPNFHITAPRMHEVRRRRDGDERWCFHCRTRRAFDYVVTDTVEPSYFDPYRSIRCAACHQVDSDLFPGRYREWE